MSNAPAPNAFAAACAMSAGYSMKDDADAVLAKMAKAARANSRAFAAWVKSMNANPSAGPKLAA
jgi:hypothetical protein